MDAPRYEAPVVTDHGTLAELTAGGSSGPLTDAALPIDTPVSQIPGFIATHLS